MNLLLIIIVILACVAILQVVHRKHRIIIIVIFILAVAFYFTFTFALNNQDVDLSSPSGIVQASRVYLAWFGQAATNLQSITGKVVEMDWTPEEQEESKNPGVMTG